MLLSCHDDWNPMRLVSSEYDCVQVWPYENAKSTSSVIKQGNEYIWVHVEKDSNAKP
jgi:hypothetical protein